MKVLHFGTLEAIQGGPAMSTYLTLHGLRERGVDAQLAMYQVPKEHKLRGYDIPIEWCKVPWEHKFGYSPVLKRELREVVDVDIYHAQGVWQYPTYAICDVARLANKPYIITPRGMLYPQDIAKSNSFFKKLSLKWRLLHDLNHAACVQVTCIDEMNYCRDLGVTSPMAIIPNPVEIKDYPKVVKDGKFRLGYLGRLSPRKNVESLIRAFADLQKQIQNAELLIIGGGDQQYESSLKRMVEELKLDNIKFAGFLSGTEKDQALASCSVLAMPSEFENLGNVVLEGLVRGIPCIATKGSPWEELNSHHCGWWINYSQEDITNAVLSAYHTDKKTLSEMGKNGRLLMENHYSVDAVAKKFVKLYQWILGEGQLPKFVYQK
jgi:glycosyltransferase involved in cell wall biosynthesis